MKKLIALSLGLVMALSLCGCLNTNPNSAGQPQNSAGGSDAEPAIEYVETYPGLEGNYTDITPEVTLRFSLASPAGDNVEWRAAAAFRDYVEASTNGQIQIQLYPAKQLGSEGDSFALVAAGDLELCTITDGTLSGFVPAVGAMAIPYLFSSGPISWQVFDSEFGDALKDELYKNTTARTLGIGEDGFRSFGTSTKQIKTLEDLKGLKIRVMETPVYLNMMTALNALPTPMSGSEVYNALEQGVVDGFENSPDVMYSMNFHEVLKYLTVDQHTVSSAWLCISDKAWSSLSEEQQAVIAGGGQIWQYYLRAPKELAATEALSNMAEHGVEVYVMPGAERARLMEACQSAVEKHMRETLGDEWVDLLLRCTDEAASDILGK